MNYADKNTRRPGAFLLQAFFLLAKSSWILPAFSFLVIFLLVPLLFLFLESFRFAGSWSLANYFRVFSMPIFLTAFARTLKLSALVTLCAAVFSYPAAWAISSSRRRNFLLSLFVLPLLTNPVARTYTWLVILGRHGMVNSMVLALGLTSEPLRILYTETAVFLGLLQLFLPYMVLSLVSAIENMPPDVIEAAYSLGASPFKTFWKVIFPLTREGLLFGGTVVFCGCVTAYVTPAMLGGTRILTLATLLYQRTMYFMQWAEGMVIAVVMMLTTLLMYRLLLIGQKRTI
jgi:putative spermidine/putrescine transport system permease protein